MVYLFLFLIIVAAVALGFVVLVQNPKGGGLVGNVGGLSNQMMGVKQTTDILEKGTWIFDSAIAILAITSTLFLSGAVSKNADNGLLDKVNTKAPISAPVKK